MAALTKKTNPSLSNKPPDNMQTAGLIAGEALAAFAPCYIKQSDGKVYNSTGTAVAAAAEVHGYTPEAYASGDKRVVLYHGDFNADILTTAVAGGKNVYLATTAGTFEDAATTGGTRKLGIVLPDKGATTGTRVRFFSCQGY